jgi:GntR family transcriptional repressor for pyruvate dehydrogenase complex
MAFNEVIRSPVYLQVANQLRGAIFAGELAPGDELPTERDLSRAFGASRASVREALRVLEAQGLITTTGAPARAVVTSELAGHAREALGTLLELSRVGLDDLVELRCVLESAALKRAAERRSGSDLIDAREALQEMRAAGLDIEAFDAADLRFHVALVRAAGNEAMHLVMLAIRDVAVRYLLAALGAQRDPRRVLRRLVAEHEQILDAVEAGEGNRAATLIESHIRRFYRSYGRTAVGPEAIG